MDVRIPRLGLTMETAQLVGWHVSVGDAVERDQPIADISTEKIDHEVVSPAAGTIAELVASPGDELAVGAVIARLELAAGEAAPDADAEPDADDAEPAASAAAPAGDSPDPRPEEPSPPSEEGEAVTEPPARGGSDDGDQVLASALARRRARETGVALASVAGTGPHGAVRARDLPAQPTPVQAQEILEFRGVRELIAKRMSESALIPQFTLRRVVDATAAVALRDDTGATFEDVLVAALGRSFAEFPHLCAEVDGAQARIVRPAAVGIAVDAPNGLITPVIRGVGELPLPDVATARRALVDRAKRGVLAPDDVAGAGFTVSNLGPFGVDEFTALIVPPQAGIAAVGALQKASDRTACTVTLSWDHRLVDGAEGARFFAHVVDLVERPETLVARA